MSLMHQSLTLGTHSEMSSMRDSLNRTIDQETRQSRVKMAEKAATRFFKPCHYDVSAKDNFSLGSNDIKLNQRKLSNPNILKQNATVARVNNSEKNSHINFSFRQEDIDWNQKMRIWFHKKMLLDIFITDENRVRSPNYWAS